MQAVQEVDLTFKPQGLRLEELQHDDDVIAVNILRDPPIFGSGCHRYAGVIAALAPALLNPPRKRRERRKRYTVLAAGAVSGSSPLACQPPGSKIKTVEGVFMARAYEPWRGSARHEGSGGGRLG